MEATLTAAAKNIVKINFGEYTITRDYDRFIALITRKSPRARFGYKVVANYSFKMKLNPLAEMDKFVGRFIDEKIADLKKRAERKAAVQAARESFVNPYKVGQILYNTWGYDQTNVDFYQVVKAEGKTIVVRELKQMRNATGDMSGKTLPIPDAFAGEEIKKVIQIRPSYNGGIRHYVNDMAPWDGKPIGYSSYH